MQICHVNAEMVFTNNRFVITSTYWVYIEHIDKFSGFADFSIADPLAGCNLLTQCSETGPN